MKELKFTTRLDLPCGCSEEHTFGEGEIVYFIEQEDKQLDKELFGFWLGNKIINHQCFATQKDLERYLLEAIKLAYPPLKDVIYDYNNNYITNLIGVFARQDGKIIRW